MKLHRISKIVLAILIIMCNIGCDQVTKEIVRDTIVEHERISLIDDNFILTRVENKGAAMGAGQNLNPAAKWIFLKLFPVAILGFLCTYMFSNKLSIFSLVGFSFLIGGGIGNIYDRFLYNSVTDFMHLSLWKFQTGIFYMADVSVMVGVGVLLVEFFFKPKLVA